MGTIRIGDGPHVGVSYVYAPYAVTQWAKQFAGCLWKPELKGWQIPNDIVEAIIENFADAHEIDDARLGPPTGAPKETLEGCHPWQIEAVSFVRLNGVALLNFDTGLGKLVALDCPVLTPRGWAKAGEISEGDLLIGRNGKPTKVLGVYRQSQASMVRVTFTDGVQVECCVDHLWHVFSRTQKARGQHEVLSVSEMLSRGLYSDNGSRKFYVPLVDPIDFAEKKLRIPPYTMGVMIGDGCLSACGVSIACSNPHVRDRIAGDLEGSEVRLSRLHSKTFGIVGTEHNRNPFATYLAAIGLNCRAEGKFIPQDYLLGSIDQRVALLQGLCDTDGYISSDGSALQYCTVSETLCADFTALVRSLGGIAYVAFDPAPKFSYKGETRYGQPAYTITFNLPRAIVPFSTPAKLARYALRFKRRAWGLSRGIVSIDLLPDPKPGVCFKVDAPDSLFVMKDYVVTHNTRTAIEATKAVHAFTACVVCPASVRSNWEAEIARWHPQAEVVVLWSGDEPIPQWDVDFSDPTRYLVVSYEWLRDHVSELSKDFFDVLVFDELHYCKNGRKSKSGEQTRTGAALQLSRDNPRAVKVGLTATPVANRIEDIHAQINVLCPDRFSSWFRFVKDYCTYEEGEYGGLIVRGIREDKRDELDWRLNKIMLRKTKAEVAHLLPPLQCSIEWIRNDASQAVGALQGDAINPTALGAFAEVVRPTKVRETVERIVDAIESGDKRICVLTHLIDSAEQIAESVRAEVAKRYGNEAAADAVVCVTGGVPVKKRAALLRDACAESAGLSVLVATMHSVGVGIDTLKVFKRVIFAELYWSPQVVIQAVGRFVRLGSGELPVDLRLLALRGTVDESIALVLAQKISAALEVGGVGKDGETLGSVLSGNGDSDDAEDFLALIREQTTLASSGDEYGVE